MNSSCKITVFTSSYNHAKYLPEAIESVLSQSFKDFEYILIDDGSVDGTSDIMEDYAIFDDRIKVIHLPKQKTKGPLLNASVKEAKGKFWVWVPADDIVSFDLLSEKYKCSQEVGDNVIIYSDYWLIDKNGKGIGASKLKNFDSKSLLETAWKSTNLIGFTGIWIPTFILKNVPIPDHIKYSEDFYWLIETLLLGHKYHHLKEKLYYKRKHPSSVTSKNLQAIKDDVKNIRKELKRKYLNE